MVARLALSSAPDPAKMIADAAGAAGAGAGGAAEGTTARDRARAARAQSHAERALLELVKDLVGSFLADSFGLPSFARVLRVFVRTGFPAAARRIVWKELGDVGLLHLLDPPSASAATAATASCSAYVSAPCDDGGGGGGDSCADDAYLYPPDVEGSIVETYLAALEHPRFGLAFEGDVESQDRLGGNGEATGGVSMQPAGVEPPTVAAGVATTAGVVRVVRGGQEEGSSSTAAGVSMRDVAVHHLACYLFPPPRDQSPSLASTEAATPSWRREGAKKAGEGGAPWRPDFGRRKMFERLLSQNRDKLGQGRGATGSSVVAAVLGHKCRGSAPRDVASAEYSREGGGGGGRGGDACVTTSTLGARRREMLQAYCRVSGNQDGGTVASGVAVMTAGDHGAEGDGSGGRGEDIVAWLDEERDANDTVDHLVEFHRSGA